MAVVQTSNNGMGIGVGMAFGADGPMISGIWANPQTGDIIEVRDSMFEDNQLIVVTTTGRTLRYTQIQNYIQCRDRKEAEALVNQNKPKSIGNLNKPQELPREVLDELAPAENNESGILADDLALISGVAKQDVIHEPVTARNIHKVAVKEEDPDFPIIKRALGDWMPDIEIVLKNQLPKDKVDALRSMFDISTEKIAKYLIENLNRDDVLAMVRRSLVKFLNSGEEIKPEKPTKAPVKMGDAKSQAASARARRATIEETII